MTEDQLKHLPLPIVYQYQRLEHYAVTTICRRIQKVGKLSPSNTRALVELSRIGADVENIEQEIARVLSLSQAEVYMLLYKAAKEDYEFGKYVFEAIGKPWIPFEQNTALLQLVATISAATAGEFSNFSRTTGFVRPDGKWSPLAQYYQDAIDEAIIKVRTGVTDYNTAMRDTMRAMSDSGLSYGTDRNGTTIVTYPSGYHRRLDTSVRNAFSGAHQRLSLEQARLVGEQIGANGMEVSWHSGARPSHVDFAGKQYSMIDFEHIAAPLLYDYNCYHRAWAIILGVSIPTHTREQLRELNERDQEMHHYDGKEYNAYTGSQRQRDIETAIRREKDRASAFAASGDKQSEQAALGKAATLTGKYRAFSNAVGLQTDPTRITVAGFTPSQAARMGWIIKKAA